MDDNSFFSVDKLVEFGLGMAMAQQMVGIMNQSMRQMYVPGSMQAMPSPQPVSHIYVAMNGSPVGPLTEETFGQMVISKKVSKDTMAWLPGMGTWKPVGEIQSLLKIIALTPPPLVK